MRTLRPPEADASKSSRSSPAKPARYLREPRPGRGTNLTAAFNTSGGDDREQRPVDPVEQIAVAAPVPIEPVAIDVAEAIPSPAASA